MEVDDEAYVETEQDDSYPQDGGFQDHAHQPPQSILSTIFLYLWTVNPWYWIFLAAALYFVYNRYRAEIDARWSEWRHRREEQARTAAIKKDPDLYRSKMEAMDQARRALQDRYDREAAEAQELARIREEEKRVDRLKELENLMQGKGYKNKVRVAEAEFSDGVTRTDSGKAKKKPMLRPEHNPLMGHGSGSTYRPSRRSGNTGGG